MKNNGVIEKARGVYENNLLLVTIIAVLIGFIMRFFAEPKPFGDPSALAREIIKEVGGFILATFLIAFIYEAFISYRYKQEFRRELQDMLRMGFRGGLHAVHERRPTLGYKAQKLEEAQESIIELGTALNTFKEYIVKNQTTDMTPGSQGYRDILEDKMKHGLKVTCLMLDPDIAASDTFKEFDPDLAAKVRSSMAALKQVQEEMNKKYPGKFEVLLYRAIPTFACIAFDSETGGHGQLLLSPYAFNKENSSVPVFEIHQNESPTIYAVYQKALHDLKTHSKPIP